MPRSKRTGERLLRERARLANMRRRGSVTVGQLRAEGVEEAGHLIDTSVLYVVTRCGVRLFHIEMLRQFARS